MGNGRRKLFGLTFLLLVVLLLTSGRNAQAVPYSYSFGCITNNGGACTTGLASQFIVTVTSYTTSQVLFNFSNNGPLASSITDVYFDDGTLLGIANVINGPGVSFSQGASPPNLPGGNTMSPAFQTTAGFLADSNSPVQPNGVSPGENLGIVFNLLNGVTLQDTVNAIQGGTNLRIGIHVQGLANGQSQSLVNHGTPQGQLPEPGTVFLLGTGLIALVVAARKKRPAH